jgi:hypothetical protein
MLDARLRPKELDTRDRTATFAQAPRPCHLLPKDLDLLVLVSVDATSAAARGPGSPRVRRR